MAYRQPPPPLHEDQIQAAMSLAATVKGRLPPHGVSPRGGEGGHMTDQRAKAVLKEAVDAVVNSFAKHTQGYGRGKLFQDFVWLIFC